MRLMSLLTLLVTGLAFVTHAQTVVEPAHQYVSEASLSDDKAVPRTIRYAGYLQGSNGTPLSGVVGVRFAIYKDESTTSSIWSESQNVILDSKGHFTAFLGAASPQGVPLDIFESTEARWLGVSTDDGIERPRMLLTSVPYALAAADAQTVGGKRPEEFLSIKQYEALSNRQLQPGSAKGHSAIALDGSANPSASQALSFEATASVGPSFVSDATIGAPLQVQSPVMVQNLNADLLHGLGAENFAQTASSNRFSAPQLFNQGLSLEGPLPIGTTGQTSPPVDFKSRVFDSGANSFQDRLFRWQAEPASSTTSVPDRLSLLFGSGTNSPNETGLSVNSDGTINFASGQQFPAAVGVSGSNPSSGQSNSTAYQWNQPINGSGIVPGTNTISLDRCPPGVNASDPSLYVYISGIGIPEAVHVTGGTCKGDGQPGTLQFTAANPHASGYTLSSASSGIQEAIAAANLATHSGNIVVPPGEYAIYAPITIRLKDTTIDFTGSTLDCYMGASCIFIGDPANSNLSVNVTLINPRGKPMVPYGTGAFIEDDGQGTLIQRVSTLAAVEPNTFGTYVQVDDDQAFTLDGLDSSGRSVRCDANFCGAYVTAPGPFNRWSAVGWLKNLNISLQCDGSGVDWQSGNGLTISNSVIQGWAFFAVRVGHRRGGYGGFVSDSVYYETSPSCMQYNPLGNVGIAGIINQGGEVSLKGPASNGITGIFPNWGAPSGSQKWMYWVAPVHPTYGDGVPLPAGYAWTNGSGPITGIFPRVAGASSYKILKVVTDGGSAFPEGTGNYLLTTVQQASCGPQTCQFTDNGQALSSYLNAGEDFSRNIYLPMLDFWPGAIIMGQAQDISSAFGSVFQQELTADILGATAVVSTLPACIITGQAQTMIPVASAVPAAAGISAIDTGSSIVPGATILKAFNTPYVPSPGLKGRLNLGMQGPWFSFSPLITLGDSNWGKTWANPMHRPAADVGDLEVGYEGHIDTLYQRASNEIREYINKFPDGKPQEALTASAKIFNVPVVINGDLVVTGTCTGCASAKARPVRGLPERPANPITPRLIGKDTRNRRVEPENSSDSQPTTGLTRAISSSELCPVSECGPGHYLITYYLASDSSCKSSGAAAVALTITWKDTAGTKSLRAPLVGSGVAGSRLALGKSSNFATGQIALWSAGTGPISYSTSYTRCASGSAKYSLHIKPQAVASEYVEE
jgi:hypothetical protein